ncbi:MAG: SUMF1/EgtB/PvdO family nonheme iron enzyme [Saprospiraceae bacterium]
MPNNQTYQLLAQLMSALQANGFRVGTGQQLRLQHLMKQLPEEIKPEALKTRLAPIFAKNREEQKLFYELFEEAKQSLQFSEKPLSTNQKKQKNKYTKWIWIIGGLIIVVLMSVILIQKSISKSANQYLDLPINTISTIGIMDTTGNVCTDANFRVEIDYEKYQKKRKLTYTLCNGLHEDTDSNRIVSYSIDRKGCLNYDAQDTGFVQICVSMAFQHPKLRETIIDTVFVEIDIIAGDTTITQQKEEQSYDIAELKPRPLPVLQKIDDLLVPQPKENWAKAYHIMEENWRNLTAQYSGLFAALYIGLLIGGLFYYFRKVTNRLIFTKAILRIPYSVNFSNYQFELSKLAKENPDAAYEQLLGDLHAEAKEVLIAIKTQVNPITTIQQQPETKTRVEQISVEQNPVENIFNDPFSESYSFSNKLERFIEKLQEEDVPKSTLTDYFVINFNWILNLIMPIIGIAIIVATFLILLIQFHLKFLLSLLIGVLFWIIIKYTDNNRKIVAELDNAKKPPFVWNIQVPDDHKIIYNEQFYSALNQMRQRTEDQFYRLNITETVKATIKSGGQINFQYTQQTRPPEYLMLIDRRSAANHRAAMFNMLFDAFRNNDVLVERFYFDSDIRLVFNEVTPNGIKLKDLKYRFQNARLLILSNGYNLLNARNGKLAKWTSILSAWKDKAIMTPNVPSNWGRKERQLAKQFVILPSTVFGFKNVIEEFENTEPADFDKWKEVKATNLEKIEFKGDLIKTLEYYYAKGDDKRIIKWIAACAVYPTIHWDLTLSIGKLLAEKTNDLELMSLDNLLLINRLPWFIEGKIPEQVRQELVEYLGQNDAEWLKDVRQHLHELLQNNPPPEDSVAFEDYQMNVVINEMMMTDEKIKKKALEEKFRKMIEQGIEPDVTVLKYLDRAKNPLDFYVPDAWKKYVFNDGKPFLGRKGWTWAIPLWTVLAILLMSYSPKMDNSVCDGESLTYDNRELCLNTFPDKVLLNEFITLDFINNQQFTLADSVINVVNSWFKNNVQVRMVLGSDPIYEYNKSEEFSMDTISFFQNIATAYFNHGVPYYNEVQKLPNFYTGLERDSACYFFQKAYELDSTNRVYTELARECTTNQEFKEFVLVQLKGKVVDNQTKKPLKSVQVTTVLDLGTYGVNTDKNGNYVLKIEQIENQSLSELEINFNKNGYTTKSQRFKLNKKLKAIETLNTIRLVKTNKPNTQQEQGDNPPDVEIIPDNDNYPTQQLPQEEREPNSGNTPEQKPPTKTKKPVLTIHTPSTVLVTGGDFYMGNDNDKSLDNPRVQVAVSSYRIGKYEVKNKEFLDFVKEKGIKDSDNEWLDKIKQRNSRIYKEKDVWKIEKGYDNHPVVGVSWHGAVAYCEWLSQKTGKTYRLPTEAEWEFAARGGSSNLSYSGSNDLNVVSWNANNSRDTYVVGLKKANSLGLYDMTGNAWEWCSDWYGENYFKQFVNKKIIIRDPSGEKVGKGNLKVIRGGSFNEKASKSRVDYRAYKIASSKFNDVGFRVVLEE